MKRFEPIGFSLDIFKERYAFTEEESWDEACRRVAKFIASAETPEKIKKYEEKFYDMLSYNLFAPGGRIMYGSGRVNAQLLNCFVLENELDSKEGWGKISYEMIVTSMTGGGCGIDFSDVRPAGSEIRGHKGICPGPLELMKLINYNGDPVRAGGGRRTALMFSLDMHHPDILEFIGMKKTLGTISNANTSVRSTQTTKFIEAIKSNNTIELAWKGRYKKQIPASQIWDTMVKRAWEGAEPGFMNWELVLSESNIWYIEPLISTNPCLTGDTLVWVADGRCNVPIKQLAEEGKDVDVFCRDKMNNTVIRTMRNPRITGYKQQIVKITLNDGSVIRTTKNHKFLTKKGDYIEAKDLKPGTSLHHIVRYQAAMSQIVEGCTSKQPYWWINNGQGRNLAEHRIVASHYNDIILNRDLVVHHKDRNAINNTPSNLEIMTAEEHYNHHAADMLGDNNPMRRATKEWSDEQWARYSKNMSNATMGSKNGMYSGISNDELREHALILTKALQRRFSVNEWVKYAKQNNLPAAFSKWRNNNLNGSLVNLSKWAANELGYDLPDVDPRTLRRYQEAMESGYVVDIINNQVFIDRVCEHCGQTFKAKYSDRERCYCSISCASKNISMESIQKIQEKLRGHHHTRNTTLREKQLDLYTDLQFILKREPLKKEWQTSCREKGLSSEICRLSSPFQSWQDLKDAAQDYNYRVVSVEEDGYEDVYNGTVDEFHNFYVGAFESTTRDGRPKFGYLNNRNCGELPLEKHGACCLGHLVLFRFIKNGKVDWELLGSTVNTGIRFLDNVLSVNTYPLPAIKEKSNKLRKIGLGTTGLADMLAMLGLRYGSKEGNELVDKLYRFISKQAYETSVMLAVEKGAFEACNPQLHVKSGYMKRMTPKIKALVEEHGIRNATLLTQAPVGTMSIVCGNCSSGIEPMFAPAYWRNYMSGDVIKHELVFHPLFTQFIQEGKDTSHFIGAHELSIRDHMEIQKIIQKHVDSSVSKTINMPHDQDIQEMSDLWLEYLPFLKGVTFYRDGSRGHMVSGPQPLTPIPREEALELYNQSKDHIQDAVNVNDCPNGMCTL